LRFSGARPFARPTAERNLKFTAPISKPGLYLFNKSDAPDGDALRPVVFPLALSSINGLLHPLPVLPVPEHDVGLLLSFLNDQFSGKNAALSLEMGLF
jgi:hypothetical protein